MKTKTYFTSSAAAIVLFMASCSNSNTDKGQNGTGTATEVQPLLQTNTPSTYKHVIPFDAIESMVNTYETERVPIINNNQQFRSVHGENFVDSKNGWVSLDELSEFIEEIKTAAKSKGVDKKDIGVRIYFSVYPQKQDNESSYFKALENEYRSKQTFLMLPTYFDAQASSHNDVLSTNGSNRAKELFIAGGRLSENNQANENGARSAAVAAESCIALNHMALCPPACPN